MTLPKGRAVLNAFVGIDLTTDAVGKPISVAPDIWYGVDDKLTIGLVHSDIGDSQLIGLGAVAGEGLCLTGSDNGCAKVYNNVALHARYGLAKGQTALALDGGLSFVQLSDPLLLDLNVGLVGRYHKGKLALEFSPRVFIAVTHRSADDNVMGDVGHDDFFNAFGTLLYSVAPKASLMVQSGFSFSIEHAGDNYFIPLSVGANIQINPKFDLMLAFSFPLFLTKVVNSDGTDAALGTETDIRSLTIGGSYAF